MSNQLALKFDNIKARETAVSPTEQTERPAPPPLRKPPESFSDLYYDVREVEIWLRNLAQSRKWDDKHYIVHHDKSRTLNLVGRRLRELGDLEEIEDK